MIYTVSASRRETHVPKGLSQAPQIQVPLAQGASPIPSSHSTSRQLAAFNLGVPLHANRHGRDLLDLVQAAHAIGDTQELAIDEASGNEADAVARESMHLQQLRLDGYGCGLFQATLACNCAKPSSAAAGEWSDPLPVSMRQRKGCLLEARLERLHAGRSVDQIS